MIHDEIVTYEVAKLAKEKGFPQDVDRWVADLHSATNSNYYNHKGELNGDCIEIIKCKIQKEEIPKEFELVAAPTQSLLQRWLREEKNIHIEIVATASGYLWIADKTNGTSITDSDVLDRGTNEGGCWDEYEQALEDAELYVLKNLL